MSSSIADLGSEVADFLPLYRLQEGVLVGGESSCVDKWRGRERLARRRVLEENSFSLGRAGARVDLLVLSGELEATTQEVLGSLRQRVRPGGVVLFLQAEDGVRNLLKGMEAEWDFRSVEEENSVVAWPRVERSDIGGFFGVSIERVIHGRIPPGGYLLPTGQWSLVVGRSGAGKTTLLEMIAGVSSVRGFQRRNVPQSIFLVPQQVQLILEISVLVNISLFSASRAEAERVARELGIGDILSREGDRSLSGGEYQRVALSQAICSRPELLLMDEPFHGLDLTRRLELLDCIDVLKGVRQGMTFVCISHDFIGLERYFDHVWELVHGGLYCLT